MVKKKVEEKKLIVSSKPIDIKGINMKIVGETPLLMEKMSDRIKDQLENLVTGKGKEKKPIRDLALEVKEKIHHEESGKIGFPAGGFKKAMVEVAPYIEGLDKKLVRGSVQIIGDLSGDLVSIKFKEQVINKSVGRDSGINRAPRIIWRPEFRGWECVLKIKYNASQISPEQILELIKLAGFHIGVGSWRPGCSGTYGMFTIQ